MSISYVTISLKRFDTAGVVSRGIYPIYSIEGGCNSVDLEVQRDIFSKIAEAERFKMAADEG